jgi:septal ring factor EnvC (AmiA/AmiB activator)
MPDEQTPQDAAQQSTQPTEQAPTFEFDAWFGKLPPHEQEGLENHTAALKSALENERQQRKQFSKELRDLTQKAEKGSEAEKTLGEMSTRLEQAEQRAAFYEEAGRPEIGCSNPRAAFLVASAEGLFTKRGDPDWPAIKAAMPELFGRKPIPGNAGTGNGSPPATPSMNDYIRSATGRR